MNPRYDSPEAVVAEIAAMYETAVQNGWSTVARTLMTVPDKVRVAGWTDEAKGGVQ